MRIPTVISLGGLADLRNEEKLIHKSCSRTIAEVAGTATDERPNVFADTSPAELLPAGIHSVLIHGELDDISPVATGENYARRARAAGDNVEVVSLPGASHYDEVAASSPTWSVVRGQIRKALGFIERNEL